jgi:tripartite-type tricarboxylate transporter receptor subunit TctC
VPFPAGGAADHAARVLSRELAPLLGQPVIVDNVSGAGGSIGAAKALSAPADGHTLLLSSPLDLILAPINLPTARYKPEDARAIALLGTTDLMLVARKGLPVGSLAELAELARSRPGSPLTYCAMGMGSINQLLGQKTSASTGAEMLGVPYTGFGPCVADMVGGRIDLAYLPIAGPIPGMVDSGNLKLIAVLGASPNRRFPQAPLAQSTPGFEGLAIELWAGVHVRADVAEPVARALNRAVSLALSQPALREAFESTGAKVYGAMSLEQAQALYLQSMELYRRLAQPR